MPPMPHAPFVEPFPFFPPFRELRRISASNLRCVPVISIHRGRALACRGEPDTLRPSLARSLSGVDDCDTAVRRWPPGEPRAPWSLKHVRGAFRNEESASPLGSALPHCYSRRRGGFRSGAGGREFQGLVLTELLMIGPGCIRVCAFVDLFDRRRRIHIDEDVAVRKIQYGLWTVK